MQRPPLTLRRNFSWTFLGNTVYAAAQWGMLVVLAKLGTPEMVGQLTLGLAITAPIFMLTNLQLRAIQATDAQEQYCFSDYLGVRLLGTALALGLAIAIVLWADYRWQVASIILLMAVAKAIESISDLLYGLFQQQERLDDVAKSMILRGILALLCLGLGVFSTGSLVVGVMGLAIAWLLVLIGHDLRQGKRILSALQAALRPRWQRKILRQIIRLALPLGIVMMLISLNVSIPRFFIERYWGERELGIFSALAALMVLGSMIVGALGQSAVPRLAKYYAIDDWRSFQRLLIQMVSIGAGIGGAAVIVAAIAGRDLLLLFYQPAYADRVDVLVWLMVAAGLGYIGSFLGYGITATRAFDYFTLPYLGITAIAAGCSQLWIPQYGIIGAAWALCAASLANCLMPLLILALIRRKKHECSQ